MSERRKWSLLLCCCMGLTPTASVSAAIGAEVVRLSDTVRESVGVESSAGGLFLCENTLVLESAICQVDASGPSAGIQVVVELWMRDLCEDVSGFQAFVSYDTSKLAYAGSLSSYSPTPFSLHIEPIDQGDDGNLALQGSVGFGGSPAPPNDALLTTLFFNVLSGPSTIVSFAAAGFDSELSTDGVPLPTTTIDSPSIETDDVDEDGILDCRDGCLDLDRDGYGNCGGAIICTCKDDDCDDFDPDIHPGSSENMCDGIDNDCDALIDEDYVPTPSTCGDGECVSEGQLACIDGAIVDTCDASSTDGNSCGDVGTDCVVQDTCFGGICVDHGNEAAGTACGDSTGDECTSPDTCDGFGVCENNHAPDGDLCGDAGSECVNQDTCLAGSCFDNGYQAAGTTCGDGFVDECTSADTCDGAGACLDNHVADGSSCGDAGTDCIKQDTCRGGSCSDNGFQAAGTACGNGTGDECTSPDTCDGFGVCEDNHAPDGDSCGDAGSECVNQDTCRAGTCEDNGYQTAGTGCGDGTGDECTSPDTCDGFGVCEDNHAPDGDSCGDAGSECVNQDTCRAGTCEDNGYQPPTTACGDGSDTECTNPDSCDGTGTCLDNHVADGSSCGETGSECVNQDTCRAGTCEDNGYEPSTTACGDPTATECTNPDSCDGAGVCLDNHISPGAACGDGTSDECTDPDTCDGAGVCQDNHVADGSLCGDTGTDCINQDTCRAGTCEDNGYQPSTTACGDPSDTECTDPDTCDGAGGCQDNHITDGSFCGDVGTECTNQDTCRAGSCEDNGFQPIDTACGDGFDTECTNPDTCDGGGACLDNHEPSTVTCGDSGTECINQDLCDGSGMCFDNGFQAAGTACGNGTGDECTSPDTCDGFGVCEDNHAPDGDSCGDAGSECVNQDTCRAGTCEDNGYQPSTTACGDPSDTECTDPDTCDGAGGCLDNHVSTGAACGDGSVGECTDPDTCDGAGVCQDNHAADGDRCGDDGTDCVNQDTCQAGRCEDHGFQAPGAACGDGSDVECTSPDSCDGSGVCQNNDAPDGDLCGDAGSECVNQDTCLAGSCEDNGYQPPTTACGDGSDTECTNPDTCDGAGACLQNHEPPTTTCGDDWTVCINQDMCDGVGMCSDNGFQATGTLCGEDDIECSDADTCDGTGVCEENHLLDPDGDGFCRSDLCEGDQLKQDPGTCGCFVADFAEVQVELVGSTLPADRCIHFVMSDVDSCSGFYDESLSFTGRFATAMIPVPFEACGTWKSVCAKDEQHTLWSTTTLHSDLVGASVIQLDGGDTDNDGDVDINDVTLFIAQFGMALSDSTCPWTGTRIADFDNDGAVGAGDYSFITTNWLRQTACNCSPDASEASNMLESEIGFAIDTRSLSADIAVRADLNTDGVIDALDVQEFEARHGLPNALSTLMRQDGERRNASSTKARRFPSGRSR